MLKNMLNQEREARLQFEQRAEEARQQLQEYISELRDELREAREERRQANEERRQTNEERNQSIVIQQAMLDAIVRLAQRQNDNGNQE